MNLQKKLKTILLSGCCLFGLFLFSACGGASETPESQRPVNEGVDTDLQITGFTEYIGDYGEMFLKEGDRIAVISPSALPSKKQTDATIKGLTDWGYVPVEGSYTCVEERTLDNCIEDLMWALEDPSIKGIYCVRGGYAANEVMDRIPLDVIRNARKPIIGFSDITIYHSAWIRSGFPTIHACMSGAFAEDFPEECAEAQQQLLKGNLPAYQCQADPHCKEGTAEGILIGGNLSTLIACIGTDYDPSVIDEPYILFLEDVGEDLQHIHRCLTVLKHTGFLDHAQGIIFGEWTDIPEDTSDFDGNSRGGSFTSVADMISRQFAPDLDIPIAYGFPAGHGDVNYPLLMGAAARLEIADGTISLSWNS